MLRVQWLHATEWAVKRKQAMSVTPFLGGELRSRHESRFLGLNPKA